jgi:hypothetical protein
MSHGTHGGGGSSGGQSGPKIPKRFLLISGLVFLTLCLALGIAPAVGASEKQTFIWSLGLSLLSGVVAFWATKTSHGSGHSNTHSHGHGKGILERLDKVLGIVVMLAITVVLCIWAWGAIVRNFGPEADEIKNARREAEEQTRQVVKGLAARGLLGGPTVVTAEVGDENPPPRTKTYTVPPHFSKPLYFSYPEKGDWEVEGTPGPLWVWDGENVWLVGANENGVNLKGGALAFRSATNYPIRVRVYRASNKRL